MNKKLDEIVLLRSFSILLVVLSHSYFIYFGGQLSSIDREWDLRLFSFIHLSVLLPLRMPLFVFISGFLFSYLYFVKGKYANYQEFVIDKASRILFPYLIYSLIFYFIIGSDVHLLPSLMHGYIHLWFLLMLFLCFIVGSIFVRIFKNKLWIGLVIGIGLKSVYPYMPSYFALNRFCEYFLWFYLGCYLSYKNYVLSNKLSIKDDTLGYLFGIFFIILLCFKSFFQGPLRLFFLSIATFCGILCLYYSTIHLLYKRHLNIKLFDKLNRYSYGIFIYHFPLILLLNRQDLFFQIAQKHTLIYPLALYIGVLLLSMIITELTLRIKIGRYFIG